MKNDGYSLAIAAAIRQPGVLFHEPKIMDRLSGSIQFETERNFAQTRTWPMASMRSPLSKFG